MLGAVLMVVSHQILEMVTLLLAHIEYDCDPLAIVNQF